MNESDLFTEAVSLHQAGNLAAADALYRQVLAADPRHFPARYQLALSLYQQRRVTEAAQAVETALIQCPDSREAHMLQGVLMLSARQLDQALASISRVISLEPRDIQAWHNRGVILAELGRFEEAIASYDKALSIQVTAEAWANRGAAQLALSRPQDALTSLGNALALRPGFIAALCYLGNAFMELKRYADAIAAFETALDKSEAVFDAWSNRGLALYELERLAEALGSYDRALALRPDNALAWLNRGKVLAGLEQFEEALASYDKTLSLAPDNLEAWRARGLVLRSLGRLGEAMDCAEKALSIRADYAPAMFLRGWLLCEVNRITEGLGAISCAAENARGIPTEASDYEHKRRHDSEQKAYLAGRGVFLGEGQVHFAGGERLVAPAVNRANSAAATAQWENSRPRIAVIDDFLLPEALEKLQNYCWGSTVWQKPYVGGYLGAFPEQGFACPLLAQIAEELRDGFPAIIGDHPLRMLWAFKYDSMLKGIGIHADQAAVNVNFWITPDEANLDREKGGMVIWDVSAPSEWDIKTYNRDEAAVRAFLERSGAKPVTVPYRANRAVVFDSDLFHETDAITFKEGYLNRRINVTMLYGRRTAFGR